ncbi:hypothetical protein HGRIS_003120 [Hohenbuehelia grisea]|uniref:ABC transmembrane type-1 domain-containing protein n=1 Tax=Hohenbuehelia grisea TaxID=104357 RepID=A0ABR3JMI0_9AGAR
MTASLYSDTSLIPAYAVDLSAFSLLIHLLSLSVWPLPRQDPDPAPDGHPSSNRGFWADVKDYVKSHGGSTIFAFKLARFLCSGILLGLTIVALILDEVEVEDEAQPFTIQDSANSFLAILWQKKKHGRRKKQDQPTEYERLLLILCITYLYTTILSLIALTSKPVSMARTRATRLARAVPHHLGFILLVAFGVYAHRDLYPLTTFNLRPRDLPSKHATVPYAAPLLWAHIAVLGLTALVLPLCEPREYVPADRNNPSKEPNPEQTASILSLLLYAFLDPIIFLAYRIPHLSLDKLPPLADYDSASSLRKRSFVHLDPFTGPTDAESADEVAVRSLSSTKRHIFFGLMRTFWREYLTMAIMLAINVAADFASPIGVNRLLNYVETRGEGAVIRPWVWISWLFVGPQIGSITMQRYLFTATATLVRAQSIMTQLVFEHALRIRVLASGDPDSTKIADEGHEGATHANDATLVERSEDAPVTPSASGSSTPPEGHDGPSSSESSHSTLVGTLTSRLRSRLRGKKRSDPKKDGKATKKARRTKEDDGSAGSTENLQGKLNNLVTTDLENITEARDFLWIPVYIPMQISLAIWFLYTVLGWSAFAGLAVMLALLPIPGRVAQLMQSVQQAQMKRTDARVQSVTETMNVLRMVKLFGWERKMNQRITEKREAELVYLWKRQVLELANGMVNHTIPVATMIATYAT